MNESIQLLTQRNRVLEEIALKAKAALAEGLRCSWASDYCWKNHSSNHYECAEYTLSWALYKAGV